MLRIALPVCLVAAFLTVTACGGTPAPAEKTAAAPAAQPAPSKVNPDDFMRALESGADDATLKAMATADPSLAAYVRPSDKLTGLHVAAANGNIETVKVLLAHGASVDGVDGYGDTPLHGASLNGWDEAVKELLDRGASVAATDSDGRTPLHLAATNGHGEVIKLLLAKGAVLTAKDNGGKLPVELARESNQTHVFDLLKAK